MKKWYTLLDPATNEVLCCTEFEEGEQPANAIEELNTVLMAKAFFNPKTRTFYNMATPEEQAVLEAIFLITPEENP